MFNLSDARTWQDITNILLVLVSLVCAVLIARNVYRGSFSKARHAHAGSQSDPHTFILPDLGITMADGGEKVEHKPVQGTGSTDHAKT